MYVIANDTGNDISPDEIVDQYIFARILASFLLMISVYLLLVTIVYEVKTYRTKKAEVAYEARQTTRGRKPKTRSNVDRMRYLLLISVSSIFIKHMLEIVELQFFDKSDTICNNLRAIKNILYVFSISPLYLVIWMRQRMFYVSVMGRFFNKFVKILSSSVVVIMFIGDVVGISLFLGTRGYVSRSTGCVVGYSHVHRKFPGAFMLGCTVTFQAILLFLFLYPLVLHKKEAKKFNIKYSNLWDAMKRTFILTSIIVLFDILAAVVSVIVFDHVISIYFQLIYDISLLAACFCVIAAFNDWKRRLFPFLNTFVQGLRRISYYTRTEIVTIV